MVNFGNMSIADLRLGASQVKAAYFGSKQIWGGEEPQQELSAVCFTAEQANSQVWFKSGGQTRYFETSTDGQNWTTYTLDTHISLPNVGDKVYFRAATGHTNTKVGNTWSGGTAFAGSGKLAASGDIKYLVSQDGDTSGIATQCCGGLFKGMAALTKAPDIGIMNPTEECFNNTFADCSSLEVPPRTLPATSLAKSCYQYMFQNCTSLTTAPELPATTLVHSCYSGMFSGCSSLLAAPALPATTLVPYGYRFMFENCSSLTSVPSELPATTLNQNCYEGLFKNCTSLTTAPALPATTLAASCYASMFSGCSSLSSVEVAFTEWTSGTTTDWVNGVAASGTFKCPAALPDIRDSSHIPTEWQVEKPVYIQNGLICWYDGIDNAGEGQHSSDTTTWKNLGSLGSKYDATRSAGTWQSNGAVFHENNWSQHFDIPNALAPSQMQGEWTYEIVFTPTANWLNNYHGLLGGHTSFAAAGICGGQYENGDVKFSLVGSDTNVMCWQTPHTYWNQYVDTLNIVACAASTTDGIAKVWHNGDLKNTVSSSSFTLGYSTFYIGAAFNNADRVFDGVIHCLRIYNRPLTESEHLHNRAIDLQRFGFAQNA